MSDQIMRGNRWALLIHSHIPIGRAPADLTPLINGAIALAESERRDSLARVAAVLTEWRESYGIDPLPAHWGIAARIAQFDAALDMTKESV